MGLWKKEENFSVGQKKKSRAWSGREKDDLKKQGKPLDKHPHFCTASLRSEMLDVFEACLSQTITLFFLFSLSD